MLKQADHPCRPARWMILIAALLLPAAALAQGLPAGGRGTGAGRGAREEDLRETLSILMMVRMKNELKLSKEQYEQILPKIEAREKDRQQTALARRDLRVRLRALLAQSSATDAEFSEIVQKVTALEEAEKAGEQAFINDIRKALTPRQQAQFLVFRERFRQWLEERLRQMREMKRQGVGQGPQGRHWSAAPPEGVDEDTDTSPEAPPGH